MATYCRHPYIQLRARSSVSLRSGGSILLSKAGPFLASGEARLARITDPLVGMASELADQCTNLEEKPSEYAISAMLRRYGFQTKSVRMNGDPKYRYVLDYQKLANITSRYATVESIVE